MLGRVLWRGLSARAGAGAQASRPSVFDVASSLRVHREAPFYIASRAVGPFQMNQYFIACPTTRKAAIFDSGSPPRRYACDMYERLGR